LPEVQTSRLHRLLAYWRPAAVLDRTARWWRVRLDNLDLFDEHATDAEKRRNPLFLAGGGAYYYLVLVLITGFVLMFWYIPTETNAWDSINTIQHGIPLGWLIRGVHKYGADAFIILITARIFRMVFCGEYKRPGELSYAIAIILLLFGMYSGLTGYLLIWNQRAFWATKVFATFPTYMDDMPYLGLTRMGVLTAQLLLGGSGIGPATITRFYMLHYTFSLLLILLTELHFYKRRYPAINTPWVKVSRMNLPWPTIVTYSLMVIIVSAMLPATMGPRADPDTTPVPVLSDWYFLALYQMFKEMKPVPAVIGTMLLPAVAIMMPWFDTIRERLASKRPLFIIIGVMALLYWILFSFMIIISYVNINKDPYIWYMSMFVAVLAGWVLQYPQKRKTKPFFGLSALALWVPIAFLIYIFCLEGMYRAGAATYGTPGMFHGMVLWLNAKMMAMGKWSEAHLYFGPWPQNIVQVRVLYNLAVGIPAIPFMLAMYWHFRTLPDSARRGTALAMVVYFLIFTVAVFGAQGIPDNLATPDVNEGIEVGIIVARRLAWLWPGWAVAMLAGGGLGWAYGALRTAPKPAAQPAKLAAGAPAP